MLQPLNLRRHSPAERSQHNNADATKRPGRYPDLTIFKQLHQNDGKKQTHPRNHRDDFKLFEGL
jgi:hypothetical protein